MFLYLPNDSLYNMLKLILLRHVYITFTYPLCFHSYSAQYYMYSVGLYMYVVLLLKMSLRSMYAASTLTLQ